MLLTALVLGLLFFLSGQLQPLSTFVIRQIASSAVYMFRWCVILLGCMLGKLVLLPGQIAIKSRLPFQSYQFAASASAQAIMNCPFIDS